MDRFSSLDTGHCTRDLAAGSSRLQRLPFDSRSSRSLLAGRGRFVKNRELTPFTTG